MPIFEKYVGRGGEDLFLGVRIDDETNPLWERYKVNVVPTVILFVCGRVSRRLDGALGVGLSEEQLEDFLSERASSPNPKNRRGRTD